MHGSKRIIFLIDDDPDDQEIFQQAVQKIDPKIRLVQAFGADEALAKMTCSQSELPDIIFLDINMPRISGLQLLDLIKQMPQCQHIPVVMYSTSSRPEDIRRSTERGAAAYITKHCSFDLLCKDIVLVLNKFVLN
ncbi:response regulator [Paraflavitalea pollutisoli]|uniref:response regulator n=1 Tax=Paraflavitalea pollutisoli TaxID=3034143 RepID=UPI0023EB1C0B|nr:response regulator [Paraflavitalea sp. H1-2-19X]